MLGSIVEEHEGDEDENNVNPKKTLETLKRHSTFKKESLEPKNSRSMEE